MHQNLHPTAPRSPAVGALEQCIVDMARRFRDPAVPRFDASQLVISYNGLLNNPQDHFATGGRYECAMEFLSAPGMRGGGLLNNIEFAPGFLTAFEQEGFCHRCVAVQRQVLISSKVRSQISFQSFNAFISFQPYVECILHVKILPGNQPLDLAALIPIALDDPLYATCNDPQCAARWGGSPLLRSRLHLALGKLFILNMARLGNNGVVRNRALDVFY